MDNNRPNDIPQASEDLDVVFDSSGAQAPTADFLASLEDVTAKDLAPDRSKRAKKKTNVSGAIIRIVTVALCLCVFTYCVFELIAIVKQYRMSDDAYSGIADGFDQAMNGDKYGSVGILSGLTVDKPMQNYFDITQNGVAPPPAVDGGNAPITSLRFQRVRVYLETLRNQNSDLIGYIKINGTAISYPVVQTTNNDYYLEHGFDKQVLNAGTIFADCRNHPEIKKNKNLILYGHNFKNGAMFHELDNYLQEEFFMNTDIEISTLDGIYTFRVFAAYKTPVKYPYYTIDFNDSESFLKFCQEIEAKSIYHKEGITFSEDDTLLTLSTCVNGQSNYRYAIHAKLVSVER